MKKIAWSTLALGLAAVSLGQGAFTIAKPFDGASVREITSVMIPKTSIPPAGYVGVFIDGKFKEAVLPEVKGNFYEYKLDTKTIEDGTHKLELKLFVDFSSQPRIVDTTSIDIKVANRSSIKVPEDGLSLRYAFRPGTERYYRYQQKSVISAIGEQDQKKGSRPFQIDRDGETIRLIYAIDNSFSNGEGLLRLQVAPDRGYKNREFAYVTAASDDGPTMHFKEEMSPVYMRIRPNGSEVWGSIPDWYGLEGNTGTGVRQLLYGALPLPVLPPRAVTPGASWPSEILQGALSLNDKANVKTIVDSTPARGEFLGVEWEMGHPCAKIRNKIAVGEGKASKSAKDGDITGGKQEIEETYWFALDIKTVVKVFREQTTEGRAAEGSPFGGSSAGAQSGGPPGGARGPMSGPPGTGGRGGEKSPDDFRAAGQGQAAATIKGGRGPNPTGGGQQRPTGGAPTQGAFVRIKRQTLLVLEK